MLKLEYTGLNTCKFHDEVIDNITEKFYVESDETTTFITFTEINKYETDDGQGGTTVTYKKKRIENEVIGQDSEGNDIYGDVIYWDDFDGAALITQIQGYVDAHDCSPVTPAKTELELVQEDLALLAKEMLIQKGVI